MTGEDAMTVLTCRLMLAPAAIAALLSLGSAGARAADPLKIGVIAQFSGNFADFGEQIGNGIDLYVRQHGEIAGRKVEILRRDTAGPNADKAKQLAQELIVRDKVDFLSLIHISEPTRQAEISYA